MEWMKILGPSVKLLFVILCKCRAVMTSDSDPIEVWLASGKHQELGAYDPS